jgi:pimeloyl-ACP methyl ester carboxylesterase
LVRVSAENDGAPSSQTASTRILVRSSLVSNSTRRNSAVVSSESSSFQPLATCVETALIASRCALARARPCGWSRTAEPMLARMGDEGYAEVRLDDGRVLEVLTGGDPDGYPWLFHSGSPSAAVPYRPIDEAARGQGLRLITYSRPGYGGSTPRQLGSEGPRMTDDVTDSAAILDELGVDDFITLGWSGGGPRALACAALLPDRCRAAATLAGVAPTDAEGLDWFAGMAPENVAEYDAAAAGPEAYAAYLEKEVMPVLQVGVDDLVEEMGGLLTEVDKAALNREYATYLTESFHRAGSNGVVGPRDDGLALFATWGFDLSTITVPVAVWQGREDAMVPYAHGEWLAAHVAGATAHLFEDEGHLSLVAKIDEILADLKALARL